MTSLDRLQVAVKPFEQPHQHLRELRRLRRREWIIRLIFVACDWLLWALVLTILFTQVINQLSDSFYSDNHYAFGRSPLLGPYTIPGNNDEPFTDRTLTCVLHGRSFKAVQISTLISLKEDTTIINTDGTFISGYRLVTRNQLQLPSATLAFWSNACNNVVTPMLANISASCVALGYNVTTDYLRIVNGLTNTTTLGFKKALPILIMLVADNTMTTRYVIPSWDGSACVFRIEGASIEPNAPGYWMYSVNRTVREHTTMEWLGVKRDEWRNGWLTDANSDERWYSDVVSSDDLSTLGLLRRYFDLQTGEVDCVQYPSRCKHQPSQSCWSDAICVTTQFKWLTAIAIGNGVRSGLFFVDLVASITIRSVYNFSVVIANISILLLLIRWLVVMVAHFQSDGISSERPHWYHRLGTIGIGCISNTRGFEYLPILLLPRMRNALAAFFTAGIFFEGEQLALAESWFKIYPGIAEVLLFYFASLNLLAKLVRRRMTDVFFGPTLVFFCVMHWSRVDLTSSGWYGFDGRVPPAITALEVGRLTLWDMFTTNATYRIGGTITSLFALKLGILAANVLPLLLGDRTSMASSRVRSTPVTHIERVLGVRACSSAGLGRSSRQTRLTAATLAPSDLLRLGYLVVDDSLVLSLSDWLLLILVLIVLRPFGRGYSFRVLVIPVTVVWATFPTTMSLPSLRTESRARYLRTDDAVFNTLKLRNLAIIPLE